LHLYAPAQEKPEMAPALVIADKVIPKVVNKTNRAASDVSMLKQKFSHMKVEN
jgi:hypothetical protein